MKKLLLLPLLLLFTLAGAQTDYAGNPVFNSVSVKTIPLGDSLLLLHSYYTLGNNIDNKRSSVFVSEQPTPAEAMKAALTLPSHFYMLTRRDSLVAMILMRPVSATDTNYEINVMQPGKGAVAGLVVAFNGRLPERRAQDLIDNRYDTTAVSRNGYLRFDRKNYKLIPDATIDAEVQRIIRVHKVTELPATGMLLLPKERIYAMIAAQSKNGNELDFWKDLTDKNKHEAIQIEGKFLMRVNGAYYQWGHAAATNGVESAGDAVRLLKEIRPNVTSREIEYMKIGFNKAYNYE